MSVSVHFGAAEIGPGRVVVSGQQDGAGCRPFSIRTLGVCRVRLSESADGLGGGAGAGPTGMHQQSTFDTTEMADGDGICDVDE